MACRVCGDPNTVRSHIVPRAFAHEIRAQGKDLTILAVDAPRPQLSQAGLFDPDLLCSKHEAITGELDAYGVEFVRRVRDGRSGASGQFAVSNPAPQKLLRFALSIVWRSVVSPLGNCNQALLGGCVAKTASAIFDGTAIEAQLFVASVSITNEGREVLAVQLPKRERDAGAWAWQFLLNGCFFVLFLGYPRLSGELLLGRADQLQNPIVANLETVQAADWNGLSSLIHSIGHHPQRR